MRRYKIDGDEIDDQKRGGVVEYPAPIFVAKKNALANLQTRLFVKLSLIGLRKGNSGQRRQNSTVIAFFSRAKGL